MCFQNFTCYKIMSSIIQNLAPFSSLIAVTRTNMLITGVTLWNKLMGTHLFVLILHYKHVLSNFLQCHSHVFFTSYYNASSIISRLIQLAHSMLALSPWIFLLKHSMLEHWEGIPWIRIIFQMPPYELFKPYEKSNYII